MARYGYLLHEAKDTTLDMMETMGCCRIFRESRFDTMPRPQRKNLLRQIGDNDEIVVPQLCRCHGVAGNLADAAPADQAGCGKEHRQHGAADLFAASDLLGKMMNIVGRAAPVSTIQGILLLVKLGQRGLDKGRGGDRKSVV